MDSPRRGDYARRRRRSRSLSTDSEEDRGRSRRRKDKEMGDRGQQQRRERYINEGDYDRRHSRRRSASPVSETQRSGYDQGSRPIRHKSKERHDGDIQRIRREEDSTSHSSLKARGPLPSQAASFHSNQESSTTLTPADEAPEKQKPNYAPTGLLAAASNSVAQADGTSIVLKYHEPAEARKAPPKDEWKLFVFKGPDILETIELSRRSCWLIGREVSVVDMLAEHPSISKQHAVIQFRYIEKRNEYGDKLGKVKPYLIDLDSANRTSLNKEEIPPSRYLELRDKDVIQLGHSTREYVLMLSPRD